MNEQSITVDQICKDIEAVADVTRDTSDGVSQIVQSSEEMAKLASNLQQMVSVFKIYKDTAATTISKPDKIIAAKPEERATALEAENP